VSVIPRAPKEPPAYSPHEPRFFDERDLRGELLRTFQICHECRMCVGYCGSFPELFARVDRDIESGRAEGAEALTDADLRVVADECWQCKLCYIKCPYTKDDDAPELLDFPRLLMRERIVRARREGIGLTDQLLGEPQLIGQLGAGVTAPLANFVNENRLLRKLQEPITGISAEFPLPRMASVPFSRWLGFHKPLASAGSEGEVALFPTCYGEYNVPEVPRAAVLVLEHNGYAVRVPGSGDDWEGRGLTCCGLPNLDGGDLASCVAKIEQNVAVLLPHVRKGRKIVVPGPSCGMMMRKEWAELCPKPEVAEVAAATVDLMEFLVLLGKQKKLKREFPNKLGTVAYHAACHLRAQKIGYPGMRVLGVVPDTDVRMVERCSAVDGTWGMKAAHYDTGRKYADKLVSGVRDINPDLTVSDCSLAALRVKKEYGGRVMHPIEAVALAYGLISPEPAPAVRKSPT